jgi:hypothetical protein
MVQKLVGARQRLRDAASARSTEAEIARLAAEQDATAARTAREGHDERIAENARVDAQALLMFDEIRRRHHAACDDKARIVETRAKEAEEKRAVLKTRARELGSAERALERVNLEIEGRVKKHEQSVADEIASRNPRRTR